MRIQNIALYSNDTQIVNFDMTGPDVRNPYVIKAITGLDAEEIVPRYYSSGLITTNRFNEMTLAPREITMRIGLKPNYQISQHPADLRDKIMKTIAASRTGLIQLRFIQDGVCWGAISGFITKFEAPVTSKDTEIQFTMRCDDPIIRSLTVTSQIELEDLNPESGFYINDPISTSPHGFKFKLTFNAPQSLLVIYDNPDPDWRFWMNYGFETGDELYFSSEYGDKYLYVVRAAVTTNLMDTLQPESLWPMIFPGENFFIFTTDNFVFNEIFWYETFWGV